MSTLDMTNMTISHAAAAGETEPVDRRPKLTEEQIADNYRRAKSPALVHVNADGTRSWKHDIVKHGDGITALLSTDRGEGSTGSIAMLRKEGDLQVEGLLPREANAPKREASGRFSSRPTPRPSL
jgi:hypothetical protein